MLNFLGHFCFSCVKLTSLHCCWWYCRSSLLLRWCSTGREWLLLSCGHRIRGPLRVPPIWRPLSISWWWFQLPVWEKMFLGVSGIYSTINQGRAHVMSLTTANKACAQGWEWRQSLHRTLFPLPVLKCCPLPSQRPSLRLLLPDWYWDRFHFCSTWTLSAKEWLGGTFLVEGIHCTTFCSGGFRDFWEMKGKVHSKIWFKKKNKLKSRNIKSLGF